MLSTKTNGRFFQIAGLIALAAITSGVWAQPPASPVTESTWSVELRKHSASTFYTSAHIHGYGDLEMLVDTGSSHLALSQTMLDTIQKTASVKLVRHLNGRMADGSSHLVPVYLLPSLRIGKDCWVHDVEAAVLPGTVRPILGMNVLSRIAPFRFSTEPPELRLSHCQPPRVAEAARGAT